MHRAEIAGLARQVCSSALMRIAIPQWQGRVSPVFDVAANLLLVDVADTREVGRQEVPLTAVHPAYRAQELARLPVNVLICGAISRPLEMAVCSLGVQVIAQVCGQVEEVLKAFLEGRLSNPVFLMPGCCGRRRRLQRGRGRGFGRGHGPPMPDPLRQRRGSGGGGPVTW